MFKRTVVPQTGLGKVDESFGSLRGGSTVFVNDCNLRIEIDLFTQFPDSTAIIQIFVVHEYFLCKQADLEKSVLWEKHACS